MNLGIVGGWIDIFIREWFFFSNFLFVFMVENFWFNYISGLAIVLGIIVLFCLFFGSLFVVVVV